MFISSMLRLTVAALALGAALAPRAHAQASPGGAPSPGAGDTALRSLQRPDGPGLARELARHEALRRQLVARIESLAARLDDDGLLGTAEGRRLQAELERTMKRLTETHARVGLDVGSRIMRQRQGGVASSEVRRVVGETERRLTSAARIGYVGITLSPTNNHVRVHRPGELFVRYFDYPTILSVEPSSPAERAGLRRGDVVVAYNDMSVRRELPMHELLRPGKAVRIRVRRDGHDRKVRLTVAHVPANVRERRTDFLAPGVASVAGAAGAPFGLARGIAGAELNPITPGLASALGVRKGLLVMRVADRSPADAAGLRDGDIIVRANGEMLEDIATLSRIMREQDAARTVTLETLRRKKRQRVRLTW